MTNFPQLMIEVVAALRVNGVPARVWQGHTESGVAVIAFLTRIAAQRDQDLAEFEADLQEHAQPIFDVAHWPDRMLIGDES